MPLVRRLMDLKTSKAICLPKSWIKLSEQETGKKMIAIAMDVNHKLTIYPIFEERTDAKKDNLAYCAGERKE